MRGKAKFRGLPTAQTVRDTSFDDEQCPVCGFYCAGKGGKGCIDKPRPTGLKADDAAVDRQKDN